MFDPGEYLSSGRRNMNVTHNENAPRSHRNAPPGPSISDRNVSTVRPRVALYARVSTTEQTTENQLADLRLYAQRRGWTVVEEYTDAGVSGTRESRPALDRLMAAARRREFDAVAVWRFDRFARSTKHLVNALDEFRHLGIAFVSHQESLDLGSPMGAAMFTIIAAIAKLERDIIAERVKSGMRRAKASGKAVGRPKAHVSGLQVRKLLDAGMTMAEAASKLRVSESTLRRAVKRVAAAA